MSTCKWDREAEEYRNGEGESCRVDEYGDPTRHCTARRGCANHVGEGELTCARCIGRVRADLRRVADLAALMLVEAMGAGVDSEAANLAGPAANPEAWSWRKIAAKQGRAWHVSLIEDDDDHHPYSVLGRWDLMIREDYEHPSDVPVTVSNAVAYLTRQLGRIAQDDAQDFTLLAREVSTCRRHLEVVLHNSTNPERGAPCPDCTSEETGVGPRLVREYGHWCEAEDCERFHYADDTADRWVCPRDRDHWWSVEDYVRWIEERKAASREKVTT